MFVDVVTYVTKHIDQFLLVIKLDNYIAVAKQTTKEAQQRKGFIPDYNSTPTMKQQTNHEATRTTQRRVVMLYIVLTKKTNYLFSPYLS